jgi:hypothetical protein
MFLASTTLRPLVALFGDIALLPCMALGALLVGVRFRWYVLDARHVRMERDRLRADVARLAATKNQLSEEVVALRQLADPSWSSRPRGRASRIC